MATFTITKEEKAHLKSLVIAAQGGDRAAFGELFQRYQGVILAIATRKLGNVAEAHELSQDVFVQAMQKIQQLRVPEAFGGWLKQITVRMAINRLVRKGPLVLTAPEVMDTNRGSEDTPFGNVLHQERIEQVREGLGRLRDMDRETLEAFYLKGQSLREMSDEFDAPIGTIKRRLHMARKRLAQEVDAMMAV